VIMISHNKEFYGALCTEEWFLEDGTLRVEGSVDQQVRGVCVWAWGWLKVGSARVWL